MLIADFNGARNEIYISSFGKGECSTLEIFTDLDKYIRGYFLFMYSDVTINLVVYAVEVNDDIADGEAVYWNTSIMIINQCDYYDVSTSYLYYEEKEIKFDDDINLYFDVYNDCSDVLRIQFLFKQQHHHL